MGPDAIRGTPLGIPVLIDQMNAHGTKHTQSYKSDSTRDREVNAGAGGGAHENAGAGGGAHEVNAGEGSGAHEVNAGAGGGAHVLSRGVLGSFRPRLAAALAAAGMLAGGCGGPSSPFSGSFHAPAGYVAYHGSGYVVAVPRQFVAKAGSVPNQPAGATVTELTRSGVSAENAQAEILLLENPHLRFTIDQVVDNLEVADRTNPNVSNAQISAAKTAVPGARAARIITESYVAPDSASNPARVTFERKWLMVLIKPGVLLDVVVADAPKLGGNIDADTVIHSFRLTQ